MNTINVLVHKADIPLKNGESLGEYTREISREGEMYLMKKLKMNREKGDYIYSTEIFSSKAIFSTWKRKDKENKYYSVDYSRKEDGNFDFKNVNEVELRQSYEIKKDEEGMIIKAEGTWEEVSKPYPNEHASRQTDPKQYKEFTRGSPPGFPAGVDAIYGIKTVGGKRKSEIQSIRFKASMWTPERAIAWLKRNKFKTNLERATGSKKDVKKEIGFNDIWTTKKSFWEGVPF